MPDDPKVVSLRPPRKPERALCTGHVPSENPDAPHLREPSNLRDLAPGDDPVGDTLAKLGLGRGIPHEPRSTRVGIATLRELRDRARSAAEAAADAERSMLHAAATLERGARMSHLCRVENETLAKRLAEIVGDDDNPPKGAA